VACRADTFHDDKRIFSGRELMVWKHELCESVICDELWGQLTPRYVGLLTRDING
jgi:hypothetical protein